MVRAIGLGIGPTYGGGPSKIWALGGASFALQNTTHSNAGTPDQYGWTQALPYFQDKNGNDIAVIQWNTGTLTNSFIFRNGGGAWTDSSGGETVLIHGAAAYDSTNNLIHVLWYSTGLGDPNGNTGFVYRRYVIQYSGNNITDIVSDNGITVGGASTRSNLVMDAQGAGFLGEQPSLLLTNNRLVAMWPMQSTTGAELRISMVDLSSNINAGKVAANWVNPLGGATATTAIGGAAPYIAFGKAFVNVVASELIPYSSLYQKAGGTNVGDLCVAYTTGTTTGNFAYTWVRLKFNSGSSNWSNGLSTPVTLTNIQRAGSDTGYSIKFQLLTNIVEDASGNAYVGMATWKSNVAGDTWGYAQILDSAETVTLVDVYSANGSHSYAPTGHIAYDPSRGLLVVSYIKTTTQFAFLQAFSGTTQKITETAVFSTSPVDIPYFLTGNPSVGNTIPMLLRNTVATFQGYSGTLTWS